MVLHCLDGKCVAEASAVLPADSALVRFGEGWCETLRIERGRAMFLEAHRARLHRSVQAAGYDSQEPLQRFDATAAALVAAHRERRSPGEEASTIGRLRILLTPRDSGGWSALGRCEPYVPPAEAYRSGLRVSIASLPHPQSGRIGKSASCHWSRYAQREAESRGADEALLAREGVLIEAASAALLWREGGQWHTSEGQGELSSVTLAELRQAGVNIGAGVLRKAALPRVQALCLVSALRLVVAVREVDGLSLPEASVETQSLRKLLLARHDA
jgi:branched-subunit amino acid aminotransferase/4-amino-4-deoxychorismate lyase